MPIEVCAALIWRKEDKKLLICQRPAHKSQGLLWEFPGGKREANETPEACLARECEEELGVTLQVHELLCEVTHAYQDFAVRIAFFDATVSAGTLQMREHNAIRWVSVAELDDYPFCPADRQVLEQIKLRTPSTPFF